MIRNDYIWTYTDEPHATRRKEILAKHPEIKNLFGYCPWTKYKVILEVSLQILTAYLLRDSPWSLIVFLAFVWGGTINHSLELANHEISHNLAFEHPLSNKLFNICVTNLPLAAPLAVQFQKYHMEHHQYQGVDGVDSDVPVKWEGRFFVTPFRKFFWLLLQPLFYCFRPMLVKPKKFTRWEAFNYSVLILFDFTIYTFFGVKSIAYLGLSTLLGTTGLHPMSGHFIAEHFVWSGEQETYSYYGPLNLLAFNVGYHNEHHDFPRIPGSRLAQVNKIAHEYYDPLACHKSWVGFIWRFIWDSKIQPFGRVKRSKAYRNNGVVSNDVDSGVADDETKKFT